MPGRLAAAKRLAPAVAIGLACAHALWSGWGAWGDLFIDTGRELELPRRLLEGEVLYRDVRFYYGPLAPYVNAALYAVFGVHLDVLSAAGAVSGVLAAVTLYLLARRFIGRPGATAAAIAFVYVCGFAALSRGTLVTIFNFVVPYAYAATYGALAALASLLFLLRHLQRGRGLDLGASASLLALAALSKVEALLPAAAVHVIAVAALAAERRLRRMHGRAYLGAATATVAVYGWFLVRAGPAVWTDNLAGPVNAGSREFILGMMGFDEPWTNLARAAVSAAALVAIGLAGRTLTALIEERRSATANYALASGAAAAVFAFVRVLPPGFLYRGLPLLASGALGVLAGRWCRRRDERSDLLPHVLLWTFVLASLPRVVLAADPARYGFFLLPAGVVAVSVALFGYLPRWVGDSAVARRAFAVVGVSALLGNAAAAFSISASVFAARTFEVSLPRGTLRLPPRPGVTGRWGGRELAPVLDALDAYPRGTRLVAVPYGTALNFLAEKPSADGGIPAYLPMTLSPRDEDAVLASWTAAPPDVVVWVNTAGGEFGTAVFGATYGLRCAEFLRANYRAITDPSGAAVLLASRRRSSRTPVELSRTPDAEEPRARTDGW